MWRRWTRGSEYAAPSPPGAFVGASFERLFETLRTDERGGVLRNSNWRARVFWPAVAKCQVAYETFPTITPQGQGQVGHQIHCVGVAAVDILGEGVDAVSVARAMIADPYLYRRL